MKELRNRIKNLEARLSTAVDKQLVLLTQLIDLQSKYDAVVAHNEILRQQLELLGGDE